MAGLSRERSARTSLAGMHRPGGHGAFLVSVRFKLALTIFVTGALTALGVIATVLLAFQRFEHETAYHRADMFLQRVVDMYGNMVDLHVRQPEEFNRFLRNLVLFEPDTQLYLLDATGLVLSSTGSVRLPPGFRVALGPVQEAAAGDDMPYVMGDDPERMNTDTVIRRRSWRATCTWSATIRWMRPAGCGCSAARLPARPCWPSWPWCWRPRCWPPGLSPP